MVAKTLGMVLCLTALLMPRAGAQESHLILHFAGFALSGRADESQRSFPYTDKLMTERTPAGSFILEQELNNRVKGIPFDHFTLSYDLGNTKSGDALAVAFVLTWENVAQEEVASDFKVTTDLRAEALVFDYQAMKVIAALPFGVESRDVLKHSPIQSEIAAIIRDIYVGKNHNIFDLFVSKLRSANIKRSYGAYAQLVSVNFGENAQSLFRTLNIDPAKAKQFVAGSFEASLSGNAGIPILPFIVDQAIGGSMAVRFANGDVFNLTLPPPDFPIRLTVRGFKKVVLDSNAIETGLAYASYFKIDIGQSLRVAPYFDENFRYAVTKVVPKSVESLDDWAAYQESMLSFFDGFTRELLSPDNAWLKQWAETSDARPQFLAATEALMKCK